MQVGILGTLELTSHGRPVPVSGARRRALLAFLVVQAGQAVPVDRIGAAVWPEEAGDRAIRTVKTYVWQLRRLFAASGPGLAIETTPGGYRLDVAPGVLDRDRFEAGLDEAARADGEDRLERLAGALSLWRGPALDEFRGWPWADQEGARLDRLRLEARTGLATTRLELGQAHAAADLLAGLAGEHPLDEHIGTLWATALARSGRPVEALRVLADLRRRLAEEAGLEPGPTLAALEGRIARRLSLDPSTVPERSSRGGSGRTHPLAAFGERGGGTTTTASGTGGERRGNLPLGVDAFIGREDERAAVAQALERHRLVTLTGPGGAGKTRLALEVTRDLVPPADGTWLVELAPVGQPDRVAEAIVAALDLPQRPASATDHALVRWLAGRELLVVLDNCEHVIEAIARLAVAVLERCPGVRLLATSRERLGIRGEHVVPVPPLRSNEAEELFAVRARAVAPDLDLGDRDLLTGLCHRLDGLPLAIELAAARLRTLSLLDVSQGLDDHFDGVGSGWRTDDSRHRTLDAVVAWSYELLEEPERSLFRRCSVFVDSFPVAAAAAVASAEAGTDPDGGGGVAAAATTLGRLVDKSLVVRTVGRDGHTRYHLLETVKHVAAARLRDHPADREAARAGLEAWARSVVDRLESAMRTPEQDAALQAVIPERTNLRSVLQATLDRGDAVAALRLVSAVPVASVGERRALIEDLLPAAAERAPMAAAQACLTLANLAFEQADWAASMAAARQGADRFRAVGDERLAAWCGYMAAFSLWGAGDEEAADAAVSAVTDTFRRCGDEFGLAYALWLASQRERDLDRADRQAAEAEGLFRALGGSVALAHDLEGRAVIAMQRGDEGAAGRFLAESLARFAEAGNAGCTAHCVEAVAALLAARGAPLADVAELAAAGDALRAASGHEHRPWERAGLQRVRSALTGREGDRLVTEARERGRALDLAGAVARAASLLTGTGTGTGTARPVAAGHGGGGPAAGGRSAGGRDAVEGHVVHAEGLGHGPVGDLPAGHVDPR